VSGRPLRLVAYTDATGVGGAEQALGYLLAALGPDIEPALLVTSDAVGEAIAAHRSGTSVHAVPAPEGARDVRVLAAHRRALRALDPDVLHSNHAWPWACAYGELAALALPRLGIVAVDHLPRAAAVSRRRRIGRRLLAGRLDAHIAVGERAARQVEELLDLSVGAVQAIPNGVPPAPIADPVPRAATGSVIGSIGRLDDQKGYDLLVRVLPELPDATAVLVGDGPERGALEALAACLGVEDRLVITGWTSEPRRHLPSFDIFALPSRWEGLPLVILEAMHAGLPVVAADVGSVAEAVRDGKTGFLVPPDDAPALCARLRCLLSDAKLGAALGAAGRKRARERFTAERMAQAYEAVYRRVARAGLAGATSA